MMICMRSLALEQHLCGTYWKRYCCSFQFVWGKAVIWIEWSIQPTPTVRVLWQCLVEVCAACWILAMRRDLLQYPRWRTDVELWGEVLFGLASFKHTQLEGGWVCALACPFNHIHASAYSDWILQFFIYNLDLLWAYTSGWVHEEACIIYASSIYALCTIDNIKCDTRKQDYSLQ